MVRPVEDAVERYVWPLTVRDVAEAVVRDDCPLVLKVVVKRLLAVKTVEEALPSVVCPVTLSVDEKEPVLPMRAP